MAEKESYQIETKDWKNGGKKIITRWVCTCGASNSDSKNFCSTCNRKR